MLDRGDYMHAEVDDLMQSDPGKDAAASDLAEAVARDLLIRSLLSQCDGKSMSETAELLYPALPQDSARSMLSRRVRPLVQRGLIERLESGRERILRLTPLAKSILAGLGNLASPAPPTSVAAKAVLQGHVESATSDSESPAAEDRPLAHVTNAWIVYAVSLLQDDKWDGSTPVLAHVVTEMMKADKQAPLNRDAVRELRTVEREGAFIVRIADLTVAFTNEREHRSRLWAPLLDLAPRVPSDALGFAWAALAVTAAVRQGGSLTATDQRRRLLHTVLDRFAHSTNSIGLHWAGVAARALGLFEDTRTFWRKVSEPSVSVGSHPACLQLNAEYRSIGKVNQDLLEVEPEWEEQLHGWMVGNGARTEWLDATLDEPAAADFATWTQSVAERMRQVQPALVYRLLKKELPDQPSLQTFVGSYRRTSLHGDRLRMRVLDNQDYASSVTRALILGHFPELEKPSHAPA